MEDVVVIGIGLRFPGRARSAEGLWSVLTSAESQWSEFPAERLNIDGFYHPSRNRQGSIPFRGAQLLTGDVAAFDAPFFAVTKDEAEAIDPQQRMLLEVSYEALENAGLRREALEGTMTSVFVGSFVKDYEQVCLRDPDNSPQYAATGNGIALMANRISYTYNFKGPSETIDTGCSGSLVSIHNAVQSLRAGESDLALAAGAGLILTPATMMPMTALNFLSPDGKCFTFDARANGYGRGEGIGVIVLKRLSDALRDNDTIRAVIRGSSKNQDGRTPGITLPSAEAQAANISLAYSRAGLAFDQTAFVECHGTGTQAGDWRELSAISKTIAKGRPRDSPVVVGSLKPNLGHLEGAAGVASAIKGILALEHGVIPPQANFETPNPSIDFEGWRIKVPTSNLEWPLPGLRRASINCFGFGGSNVHLIIDEAASYLKTRSLQGHHNTISCSSAAGCSESAFKSSDYAAGSRVPHVFTFCGPDKQALRRILTSQAAYLESVSETPATDLDFLRNYSYTLGCRRSVFEWRIGLVSDSIGDLLDQLKVLPVSQMRRASNTKLRVCFVFAGQGTQWAQMGQSLYQNFKVFRDSIDRASDFMQHELRSSFNLVEELFRAKAVSNISRPDISQPATTAWQIAMVDLISSFSVEPSYVLGHSSGEIAAAYSCGSLTREAAWTIAYYRGFYAASVPILLRGIEGGMLATGLSQDMALSYADMAPNVQVACANSFRSTTLSGPIESLQLIAKRLTEEQVFHRFLATGVAYHSDHMKLVSPLYERSLRDIRPRASAKRIRMFSSVSGEEISGDNLDGAYWARNMVSIVQYSSAVESMMSIPSSERPVVMVEISPRAALFSPTSDTLSNIDLATPPSYESAVGSSASNSSQSLGHLLQTISNLWAKGSGLDILSILRGANEFSIPKCLVDLPSYPWNHTTKYWFESHLSSKIRFRPHGREDLIGVMVPGALPQEPSWRHFLRISENPWLQDHKVQKAVVFPAAGYVTMVLEAAKQMSEKFDMTVGFELLDVKFEKALLIPSEAHGVEVLLSIKRMHIDETPRSTSLFSIYSRLADGSWQTHATGKLNICHQSEDLEPLLQQYVQEYERQDTLCTTSVAPRQLYELLDNIGMNYGQLFRNINSIRIAQGACVSRITIPDTRSKMPENFEYPHLIHPATLDSMIHTLFAIDMTPRVPVSIQRIFVSSDIAKDEYQDFHGVSTAERLGFTRAKANIAMSRGKDKRSYVIIEGMKVASISDQGGSDGRFLPNTRNLCSEIIWKRHVQFAEAKSLSERVDLLSHKAPGLSILQVGVDKDAMQTVLDVVAPVQKQTPRLSRYTLAKTADGDDVRACIELAEATSVKAFLDIADFANLQHTGGNHLVLVARELEASQDDDIQLHIQHGGVLLKSASGSTVGDEILSEADDSVVDRHFIPLGDLDEPFSLIILVGESRWTGFDLLWAEVQNAIFRIAPSSTIKVLTLCEFLNSGDLDPSVIVLSLLSVLDCADPAHEWTSDQFEDFHALQSRSKKLLWLTQGCHMNPTRPEGSSLVGLMRVLMAEDPKKTYAMLDLGADTDLNDAVTAQNICNVLQITFFGPHLGVVDVEYAEYRGELYIPRLVPVHELNDIIEPPPISETLQKENFSFCIQSRSSMRHTLTASGGHHFERFLMPELGHDEVEIMFESAPLSSVDVSVASGATSRTFLGCDVRGHVSRIGSDVSRVSVDDDVAGLIAHGAIQSLLRLDQRLVRKVPGGFIPSLYVTAFHALSYISRARNGQSVLIHPGAGPHGLAAVAMSAQLGLRVLATTIGSEDDRQEQSDLLQKAGVSQNCILDANSAGFVTIANQLTASRGVDIVYSLAEKQTDTLAGCVRRNGYLVCPQTMAESARAPSLATQITFAAFDLHCLIEEDPDFVGELFDGALDLMSSTPHLPALMAEGSVFFPDQTAEALQVIAKSPHTGFVTIKYDPSSDCKVNVRTKVTTGNLSNSIDPTTTYLIIGGFHGLGKSIADLLIESGAKHIVFMSRSAGTSTQSEAELSELRATGTDVRAFCADICDKSILDQTVAQIISEMPPIKGLFQCAAVIQDAVFDNMTFEDWKAATRPKILGSQNLVDAMNEAGQDPFYIFLASSSGVIGNRGQANYAAGNAFEDALARSLRLQGKHAVSLDLGPVLGAGMLNEDEAVFDMLRASGFYSISHDDFLTLIKHAIMGEIIKGKPMPAQITTGVGTGGLVLQNQPADPYWTRTALFSYLNLIDLPPPDLTAPTATSALAASFNLRAKLTRAPNREAAAELIASGIQEMLAKSMNMLPEEISVERAPNAYGVDSLVAIGLRNWVQGNCDVEISLFEVLSERTVQEMAGLIAERGGYGAE